MIHPIGLQLLHNRYTGIYQSMESQFWNPRSMILFVISWSEMTWVMLVPSLKLN